MLVVVDTRFVFRALDYTVCALNLSFVALVLLRASGRSPIRCLDNRPGFLLKVNFRWNDPNFAGYFAVVR